MVSASYRQSRPSGKKLIEIGKSVLIRLGFFCAFLAILFFFGREAPAAEGDLSASYNALVLDQFCSMYGGMQVTLTSDGVKAVSPKSGLVLLYKKPYKNVILYCEKTRKYFQVPFAKFTNPFQKSMMMFDGLSLVGIPIEKERTEIVYGLSLDKYVATAAYEKKIMTESEVRGVSPRRQVNYWVTSSGLYNANIGLMLNRYYGLPSQLGGVPIRLDHCGYIKQFKTYLITNKVSRKVVPQSILALPTGYKLVQQAQSVLLEDGSTDAMQLIMMGSEEAVQGKGTVLPRK